MTYSIIGSGLIGSAIARQFSRAGLDILIANRRGADSLDDLARELGPHIKPVPLALLPIWSSWRCPMTRSVRPPAALRTGGEGWSSMRPTRSIFPLSRRALDGWPSSDIVADTLKGARVVKAFNTLPAAILAKDPTEAPGRRVLFVSGNDDAANAQVAGPIQKLGFAPIMLGKVAEGGRLQQFGGPLAAQNFIKAA